MTAQILSPRIREAYLRDQRIRFDGRGGPSLGGHPWGISLWGHGVNLMNPTTWGVVNLILTWC